jgi:hypothetical protein
LNAKVDYADFLDLQEFKKMGKIRLMRINLESNGDCNMIIVADGTDYAGF